MKKVILLSTILLLMAIPVFAAPTLWLYYAERGQNLPSVSERAPLYANIAKDAYTGSYSQNIALLDYLQNKPANSNPFNSFSTFGLPPITELLGGNVPASAINWTLASPLSSTDTTIDVSNFEDLRDNAISTSSMPTKIYFVIEAENTSNTEIVMCLAANGNESTTKFTGCTRGLPFSGTSESSVTANKKSHPAGASVIMSNPGQFYNNFVDTDSTQSIGGAKTFTATTTFNHLPTLDSYKVPTDNAQLAAKKYVDDTVTAGAPDGTESVKGINELATQAEMAAGTVQGSTATNLVLQSQYASSTPDGITIPITESDGDLNAGFIGQDQDYTWIGLHTFSATTTLATSTITSLTLDSLTLNGLVVLGDLIILVPSDNLQISSDSATTTTSGSDVKMKEFTVRRGGKIRVKFTLDNTGADSNLVYGRIYVNGSAVGAARSTTATLTTYSEDISIEPYDEVQIYAHAENTSQTAQITNFRLYFDQTATSTVVKENNLE